MSLTNNKQNNSVYVGNLSKSVDETLLKKLFGRSKIGLIKNLILQNFPIFRHKREVFRPNIINGC